MLLTVYEPPADVTLETIIHFLVYVTQLQYVLLVANELTGKIDTFVSVVTLQIQISALNALTFNCRSAH